MKIKARFETGLEHLSRRYDYDAGIDLPLLQDVKLSPLETKAIPTGLRVSLPAGTAGMLIVRSSVAKLGIVVHMSPIDSGYDGEIHLLVTNASEHVRKFKKGERIAQFVVVSVVQVALTDEYHMDIKRGMGGLGSTGK